MEDRSRAERRTRYEYSDGNYLTVHVQPSRRHRHGGSRSPERRRLSFHRGYHSDNESRDRGPRHSDFFDRSDPWAKKKPKAVSRSTVPDLVHAKPTNLRRFGLPESLKAFKETRERERSTRAQVPDPPRLARISYSRRRSADYQHDLHRHTSDIKNADKHASKLPSRRTGGRVRSHSDTEMPPHSYTATRADSRPSVLARPDPVSTPRRPTGASPPQPIIVLPYRSKPDSHRTHRNPDASTLVDLSLGSQKAFSSASGTFAATEYHYRKLGASEFRLVRLFRKTLETIRCEIVHESMDMPPVYTAVSYAWGDPDEKCDIEIEHEVFDDEETIRKTITVRVTVNLYGALRAIREEDRDVLVWIDGLSIDQDNNEERARQVRQMSKIYRNATTVAIWLGPEENNSNTAIRILKEIAETERASGDISSVVASYAGKPEFGSLVSLFERDYWKRLWVVQEVFIPNPSCIHVYCGECRNTWHTYKIASNALERCRSTIERCFPSNQEHSHYQRISGQQYSFAQVLALQGPASLPDGDLRNLGKDPLLGIMRLCRDKFTANPLDKLYGILGLLPEDSVIKKDFRVDYTSSVKALYVRIVDHVLSTTKRLDILREAIHFPLHASNASLPTWCPDWYHMPATRALRSVEGFKASKDRSARYRFLETRQIKLEIEAIHLGTVVEHGVAIGTLTTSVDHLTAFLSWRALLLDKTNPTDKYDEESLANTFCRTLCLGQLPHSYKSLDLKTLCYHVFGFLLKRNLPRLVLDEELAHYAKLNYIMSPSECRPFLNEFTPHMMGRRFCLLGDRRTMGLGSGFIGANDIVVVPLGCSTPIVLRREGPEREYRYVGDIYIDQYMYGRAVDQFDEGRLKLHSYVLH